MRKTLIAAAMATAFASPSIVFAADAAPTPTHTFAPNVGVVSDYLFRGISQTRHAAALQGGVDYSHSSGLYAGVWGSTISWVKDALGSGGTEIDLYGGYKNTFAGGDWTYDVGLIHYNYPGSGGSTKGNAAVFSQFANPNTTEVYGAIGYKWVTVKYSQAISSHFIGWVPTTAAGADATRNTKGSNYLEINAAYDVGNGWGVSGHVGKQKVKNVVSTTAAVPTAASADYTDWNIGVTKDVGFGVVGLTYSDTDAKGSCSNPFPAAGTVSAYCWGANMNSTTGGQNGFKDVAKGTIVLSFKKTF
jgi:uncharacterized protein (TIGR02001 family)